MQNHILLNKDSIRSLLDARISNDIQTLKDLPPPESLCNLTTIAKEIHKSIKNNKKITLIGDYDVDGVVSSVIVKEFFDLISYPLDVVIPNRFKDGYGISKKLLERISADVIITVDNGINAVEAAKICEQKNIKLIITDHHNPPEILPSALICNPKLSPNFPQADICGACVAWYMCAALKKEMNLGVNMTIFLDFLALAIVSDVMPLSGINRVLLKKGIECIKNSNKTAFKILKEKYKSPVDCELISFSFAPLLNCAGRMDSAMLSYEFLCERDYAIGRKKFEHLLLLNEERKKIQNQTYLHAKDMCENSGVIVVYDESWHEGILGIVSARLSEEYKKTSIVLSTSDEGGVIKGSMRGESCMEILDSCSDLLLKYGGHNNAAGLSLKLENLEQLKDRLRFVESFYARDDLVLGEVLFKDLDDEFFNMILCYEPYGEGNFKPHFKTKAKITNIKHIGNNGGHSAFMLRDDNLYLNAIKFGEEIPKILENSEIEIVFCHAFNYYGELIVRVISYKEKE